MIPPYGQQLGCDAHHSALTRPECNLDHTGRNVEWSYDVPEQVEERIIELFRRAIAEFPDDLREYAEEWITTRQKAMEDIKGLAYVLQLI